MTNEFLILIGERSVALDKDCPPFSDPRSALDELQRRLTRIRAAINDDDHLEQHRQLVTLLAHGCRMARDLSLETEAAAVLLDDAELGRK
jgi:DNA-binding SARP family transcriptional activator